MANPLIVVATDLSPESERAFVTGAMLARATGAELRLLHALRDVPAAARSMIHAAPTRDAEAHPDAARAHLRLQELVRQCPTDLTVSTALTIGDELDSALAAYAVRHAAQFLVIASHGRSGVRRLVLGSVAEGVLRQAKVPVVVVPI